jgi:hypothetical protein
VGLKSAAALLGEGKTGDGMSNSAVLPLQRSLSLHGSSAEPKIMANAMYPSEHAQALNQNGNPSPIGDPAVAAWTEGRIVEASRELRKLEDAGKECDIMNEHTIEQIHRIAARYEQSLGERNICGDWIIEQDTVENISVAYRTGSTLYQTAITIDFDGLDPLMAFVALCENDLSMCYDTNCEGIQQLGGLKNHPLDSVWRMQRTTQFDREDNIRQISCLDALDEPDAALWVSMYPPQAEDAKILRGIKLPPPLSGRKRNVHSKTSFFIEPVKAVGGGFLPGFRLVYTTCTRPSAVVQKFLSVTPRRLIVRQLRDKASHLNNSLRDHMGNCAEMAYRWFSGPRAGFYKSVAKRLAGSTQLALDPLPPLDLAPLQLVKDEANCEEGEDYFGCKCNDTIMAPRKISISDVKTMADLSMHVTSNWAD